MLTEQQIDAVREHGDEVFYTQHCEYVVRKKKAVQRKGARIVVVGHFGLYLFNGKKVR